MKILFFNRFFFPDTSATSQLVSDLAFHLAASGQPVHVVTARVPGGEISEESVRGVAIHRVADTIAGPHGLARRGAAYLHYYRGARRAARSLIERGDIVVLMTDPPLLSSAIGPIARSRGARVVVWMQDVFPEIAREYGVPGMGGPTGAALRAVRDRSLASADAVVAIGDAMAARVATLGCVAKERLHVIHNWANGNSIVPVDVAANAARGRWGLEGMFVVGYSGNLGRVHEFDTLLEAAKRMRDDAGLRFLIVGRGPQLAAVRARVEREGLDNVRFAPHQEREALAESLGAADVHVSVLRPEFAGLVHPSKLYGIMAAGRPTLFIGDPGDETAAILAATGSGVSVKNGDADGLAKAIRDLRADGEARAAMGRRARRAFDERFAMPLALSRWQDLFDKIA